MAMVFHSLVDDPMEWEQELHNQMPGLDYRVWPDAGNLDDIEIALVWKPPFGMLEELTNLKLILSLGAGVDHLLDYPGLPPVPIARLIDKYCSTAMTEYVLLQVMRFHRADHVFRTQQQRKEWTFHQPNIARDREIGIMGLGALGMEAAKTLVALGFNVRGWSRSRKTLEGVVSYCGNQELHEFLSATEILICMLALTPETNSILNSTTLSLLPRGASVVNVGRGDHLVEDDLVELLNSGHISAAALDCFRREPLDESSPFWNHPNVFITPHAATGTYAPSAAKHVVENIRRFYDGEPLLNQLDMSKGY